VPAGSRALLHGDITNVILGAFYSVYSELGFGFLEAVYINALVFVLKSAQLRVDRQVPFDIHFRGQLIGQYRADLVIQKRVVVEVKTGKAIVHQHSAQLLNYLKASRLEVGLLLHFGDKPAFRRVVLTRNDPRQSASSV
jgi:GxxExxY protein